MSFSYVPMTDSELHKIALDNSPLLQPGIYDLEVSKATAKTSSNGNPMIELQIKVWGTSGKEYLVFDYLVSTPLMAWKIKHFCHAVGILKEYMDGQFNADMCIGKFCKGKIVYQIGKEIPADKLNGKVPGSRYPDKNAIEDYLLKEVKNDPRVAVDPFNDPLPF